MDSLPELSAYIDETLREFGKKTGVIPPIWIWTTQWPIFYNIEEKVIYVPDLYLATYVAYPYETKQALRWALAHDFWHYFQDVRGAPLRIPILSFPRVAEYFAGRRAMMLSGISTKEGEALTRRILGMGIR